MKRWDGLLFKKTKTVLLAVPVFRSHVCNSTSAPKLALVRRSVMTWLGAFLLTCRLAVVNKADVLLVSEPIGHLLAGSLAALTPPRPTSSWVFGSSRNCKKSSRPGKTKSVKERSVSETYRNTLANKSENTVKCAFNSVFVRQCKLWILWMVNFFRYDQLTSIKQEHFCIDLIFKI